MDLKKVVWLCSVVLIAVGAWLGKYGTIVWQAELMIIAVLVLFIGVIIGFVLLGGQSTDTQDNTTGQGRQLALQQGINFLRKNEGGTGFAVWEKWSLADD